MASEQPPRNQARISERLNSAAAVKRETEELIQWRNFAGGVVLAMLLGATLIQKFVKTLDPGNVFDLSRFALCIMLILMALLWLRAGTIELEVALPMAGLAAAFNGLRTIMDRRSILDGVARGPGATPATPFVATRSDNATRPRPSVRSDR